MSRFTDHKGTYRYERFPKALSPDYFKLDDRSTEDLVEQTAKLAKYIRFYNEKNSVEGNWEDFFVEVYDYVNKKVDLEEIENKEKDAQVPPHLALYFAFVKVFNVAQEELNRFTQRHLEYYYNNILKFERKEAVADKVHLFFQLDKKETKELLPQGTLFDGGNDNNGKKRIYASDFDLIVNRSEIKKVKTVTVKRKDKNSFEISTQDDILKDTSSHPAEIGFAISSTVFYLKDGERSIEISFKSDSIASLVRECAKVEYTSPAGWQVAEVLKDYDKSVIQAPDNTICIRVSKALPPVVKYDDSLHQMHVDAKDPVLRFVFKPEQLVSEDNVFKLLKLSSDIIKKINVSVKESKDLLLYNDYGKVSDEVPFLPFGPIPKPRSSRLIIGNNKIFNKYLKSFGFSIEWKGLPDSLEKHYETYKDGMELLKPNMVSYESLINGVNEFEKNKEHCLPGLLYYLNDGSWTINREGENEGVVDGEQGRVVVDSHTFTNQGDAIRETVTEFSNDVKSGFLKVVMSTDFGHDVYGNLLGKVMMENTKMVEKNGVVVTNDKVSRIPEMPYTPEIQSLSVNYELEAEFEFQEHQLFSIHPFSNMEVKNKEDKLYLVLSQHGFDAIAEQGNGNKADENRKSFYFGIVNSCSGNELSIYFNIDNPVVNNDKNEYVWGYYGKGKWKLFKNIMIVRDNTEKFNKSGIITFMLPDDAEELDGKVWICLAIMSSENVFPNVLNARTNCVTATFVKDEENELSHLKLGLPQETIRKFVERNPKIKSVEQPYTSLGGKEAENDTDFYTRISERLRHKNRASTAWDYEHLILEAFPEISFALCFPHTRMNQDATDNKLEFAPGYVSLLVSPNTDIVRQDDILKPLVPVQLINEIRGFLNNLASEHVSIDVSNFDYKELQVTCEVQLRKGFADMEFYRDKLNSDLKRFISPWLGEGDNKFEKNMTYKSKNVADLYSFLENLEYIDFVVWAEISMGGRAYSLSDKIIEKNDNEIFTSVKDHNITIVYNG